MESLIVALNAVAPMFLLIGVGLAVRAAGLLSEETVHQANSLCFRVFVSTLLFYNIYKTDLSAIENLPMVGFCAAGVLVEFLAGLWIVKAADRRPPVRGVMLQAFFRTNLVLLSLPIIRSIYGESVLGTTTLVVAVIVPLINVLSVVALELFRGGQVKPAAIVRGIFKNPLVLGTLVGLVFLLTGLRLPHIPEKAVADLASAATPLALVLLGASLNVRSLGSQRRNVTICMLERLVVSPALFVTLAAALGIRGMPLACVMLTFGCPVAVNSFTMAMEMDGDVDLAGELVLVSTGLSCVTLFLWIFFLRSAGLI